MTPHGGTAGPGAATPTGERTVGAATAAARGATGEGAARGATGEGATWAASAVGGAGAT